MARKFAYDERTIDEDVERTLEVAAKVGSAMNYRMNDVLVFVATGETADRLYPVISAAERLAHDRGRSDRR